MPEVLNGELLRIARQYRGLDQKGLAEKLNVAPATISRAENGVVQPSDSTIDGAARELRFPREFFFLPDRLHGLPLSAHAMWRRRKSVTRRSIDQVLAEFNIRMLHVRRLVRSVTFEPRHPLPRYEVDDYQGDIEKIAADVRRAWNIPRGPLADVTAYAEAAGILVFHVDLENSDIDGATISAPDLPPCVFLNKFMPADRLRFSLAHEIGHIIMHRFPSEAMETEANRFAGALLMPRADIHNEFAGQRVDLRLLARLKPIWRVAMQSLLYRAGELGFVDKSQTAYLWRQFNFHHYRMREPAELDFDKERPTLVSRLFHLHLVELGYSMDDLQTTLRTYADELITLYGLDSPRPGLRLVT